jgi:hypothetical protein
MRSSPAGYNNRKKAGGFKLVNRIDSPEYPQEAPQPNSVPHPATSPPEFPLEIKPAADPPQGDFLL